MRLVCKHCPEEFVSLDLRQEVALKEIVDKLCHHVVDKHRAWAATGKDQMQKGMMLMVFLHTMETHAAVPETEQHIHNEVEKHMKELLSILGYKEEAKQAEV